MSHLKDINKSWYEHFKFAIVLSYRLAKLSIISLIHSIFPNLFVDTVSESIKELNLKLNKLK
jgi:hypothetical protein